MQEITLEISELAGVFAADGSMQEEHICFWGNPIEDKEYYDVVLKDLFKKAFEIDVRPHLKESNGVYGFYVCKKHVLDYFINELDFKPGPKTYTVKVPKIILESKDLEIQKAFVKGYASADGGLNFYRKTGNYCSFKKKFHYYPRLDIVSVSKQIIEEMSAVLEKAGIQNIILECKSSNEKYKTVFKIAINGKDRLKKYANLIGFSNPKDETKFEIFKRFGFCPTNTNIIQRYSILNNELDIYSFYKGP